jgi:uncharacterized delta-60 repeat protein
MSAFIPTRWQKKVRAQSARIKNQKRLVFERLEDRLAPAAGNLDLSFGSGTGSVVTDFGAQPEGASAVALQPDGKVLAGGWTIGAGSEADFAIGRYMHSGSLNGANTPQPFSFDGKVTTDFGGSDKAHALLVQGDGKIVAVGTSESLQSPSLALARYNANGTLDLSFGPDGTGKVLAGEDAFGLAAALQSDGKIVVAGAWGQGLAFLVARFTTDGLLDATFGGDGVVTAGFGSSKSSAGAVTIQSDGKIVVAGYSDDGLMEFAAARFLPDGDLDPGFGNIPNMPGLAEAEFNSADALANSVAIQADGRIVVAGGSFFNNVGHGALARFLPTGQLDSDFDADGLLTYSTSGTWFNDVTIQSNGKIVVGGYQPFQTLDHRAFFAKRFEPIDGSQDPTFHSFSPEMIGMANAIALQPDGDILLAGSVTALDDDQTDFRLVRLQGDPFIGKFKAVHKGSTLSVTCTNGSDQVAITDLGTNGVTIKSLRDGAEATYFDVQSIQMNFFGGDDDVTYKFQATAVGDVPAALQIDLGAGDDHIEYQPAMWQQPSPPRPVTVNVKGGAGMDRFDISLEGNSAMPFAGQAGMNFDSGPDADQINFNIQDLVLSSNSMFSAALKGGLGDDNVFMNFHSCTNNGGQFMVSALGGGGNDTTWMHCQECNTGVEGKTSFMVDGGDGIDYSTYKAEQCSNSGEFGISFLGGAGNDTTLMHFQECNTGTGGKTSFTIDGGNGNDYSGLTCQKVNNDGGQLSLSVMGGAGNDWANVHCQEVATVFDGQTSINVDDGSGNDYTGLTCQTVNSDGGQVIVSVLGGLGNDTHLMHCHECTSGSGGTIKVAFQDGSGDDHASFDISSLSVKNGSFEMVAGGGTGSDELGIIVIDSLVGAGGLVSLKVDRGSGDDRTQIHVNEFDVTGGTVGIDYLGGTGNDDLGICFGTGQVGAGGMISLNGDGGAGDDRTEMHFNDAQVSGGTVGMNYLGGTGNDELGMNFMTAQVEPGGIVSLHCDSGMGNDRTLFNAINFDIARDGEFDLSSDGGAGNDELGVIIQNVHVDDGGMVSMHFNGGAGNDRAYLKTTEWEMSGKLTALLEGGDGNDDLGLELLGVDMGLVDALIDGGLGRDRARRWPGIELHGVEIEY